MNVKTLEDKLFNNSDNITKVLIALGFREETIEYHQSRNFISAVRLDDTADNRMGFIMYCDNTYYYETTRSDKGNIFKLVMKVRGVNFPKSLDIIASILGIKETADIPVKVVYPFQSFRKLLVNVNSYPELKVEAISDQKLPPADSLSFTYLKDGVSLIEQEKRGVRYDHQRDAVITPIYSFEGKLIGAKARANSPNTPHDKRFYALVGYPKSLTLYGYSWNYAEIQRKRMVVIVEAEKSVLQAESFGFKAILAIGGHCISDTQARYIRNLFVETVVVAFDSDISEEEIKYEASKLLGKPTAYFHSNIYYIYDKEQMYMNKKDKMSPTDKGRAMFSKIINKCRHRLEGDKQ